MSTATASLLGVRRRNRSPWVARFVEIAHRLVARHGVPSLGNFRDPVKEILYILLSAKTTDAQYRLTHRKLMASFPTLAELAAARVRDVRRCIDSGGLAGKRAGQVVRIARTVAAECGARPARFLRSLAAREAYDFLISLPGVGPKSAFCVMMYSLDFDVFAVDVNVQRIAERLGAIRRGLTHHQAQRRLAAVAPDGHGKPLHVAMVVHGRTVCLPRKPLCGECCLADLCAVGRKWKGAPNG